MRSWRGETLAGIARMVGLAVGGAVAALFTIGAAFAAADCPPSDAPYPAMYGDAAMFSRALAKVDAIEPANRRLSGVTVPHHLVADHLVALGLKSASGFAYKRIVLLSPDHFRRSPKPFATTARGFETPMGTVETDTAAVATLLEAGEMVADSCLFGREHGVHALLPLIRHFFPDTPVVPVAISIKTGRADWERMADLLAPLVDGDTLIVESTDFSHYRPQHEARLLDQQTLNTIASGSLDALSLLTQPDHLDSLGALYIQMKLQAGRFAAKPLVIANENQQQYQAAHSDSTTSYQVILFGRFEAGFRAPTPASVKVYYLAGDTNFGRAMKLALLADGAEERVAEAVLSLTGGRPLVVNLEGVILPNVPEAIDDMTLAMPKDLALHWLKKLNVAAVGLANNHAFDLGDTGYAETKSALAEADIASFGQGERLALPGLDIVGLSDLDTNGKPQVDLITEPLLDTLKSAAGDRPVIAFVHWGREYLAEPSGRERALADAFRLRSATLAIGAHPHVASSGVVSHGGGDMAEVYSLGNFLFDQNAERASGQLVELRVFEQGTVFVRTIPLPNLFEIAKGR